MASKIYSYNGRVVDGFGNILDMVWYGETIADSIGKAESNLKYQYKKERSIPLHTKISLPSRIMAKE